MRSQLLRLLIIHPEGWHLIPQTRFVKPLRQATPRLKMSPLGYQACNKRHTAPHGSILVAIHFQLGTTSPPNHPWISETAVPQGQSSTCIVLLEKLTCIYQSWKVILIIYHVFTSHHPPKPQQLCQLQPPQPPPLHTTTTTATTSNEWPLPHSLPLANKPPPPVHYR